MDQPVEALRPKLPYTVFVDDKAGELAVIRWVEVENHRRTLVSFQLGPREGLQVFRNAVIVIFEPHREIDTLLKAVSELAAMLPEARVDVPIDCGQHLPANLRHLSNYFANWAIADDEERSRRVSRSSKAFRSRLRAEVEPLLGEIDHYLDSFDTEPLHECALQLGYLAELVAELRSESP